MSKSRLEKFLYALYSLDSSDLPNPLSRIEDLYKCLVTGEEAPSFEPISRVEKYLMAILGVYNVELLPNPLSRVEVLLYKLATGYDNLDDIKSFLSEHEELLAEIIRNGGVGGNIDIEYVLYTLLTEFNTLYNTAEKPVKSAILKGNTLVNLYPVQRIDKAVEENKLTDLTSQQSLKIPISNGKKAIFTFNISTPFTSTFTGFCQTLPNWNLVNFSITNGKNFIIFDTTNNNDDIISFDFYIVDAIVGNYTITDMMVIEYQDGMENWGIPYFESMQSVKMPVLTTTGKNLFDPSNLSQTNSEITPTLTGYILSAYSCGTTKSVSELFPNLIIGKEYTVSFQVDNPSTEAATNSIGFYNPQTQQLSYYRDNWSFTLTNEMYYERSVILYGVRDKLVEFSNVQIEEGSIATPFENFKTNILTTNEEVELRKVGNVQDELNLLTGELTQHIGEVVLDGSESWNKWGTNSFLYRGSIRVNATNNKILSDKLPVVNYNDIYECTTYGIGSQYGNIGIRINNVASVEDLKMFLSQNPITVQYPLTEESIKTVDLSVVNQDGNNTKLSTFNDITYVTLSSEGVIPEAELEVATKNEEVLNIMNLEMDDISTTQNALQETSNTQSENVDSTMLATTEIYEGLL